MKAHQPRSRGLAWLAVAATACLALSSCTSVARGLGSITANKYAKPRHGTTWIVPPPQLDPPSPQDKTVYISFRNISDADIDLTQTLKDAASAQGWTLVNDPQQAKYRLRASMRFFGEVEPETGGFNAGSKMGVIAGAAVGIGTGMLIADATDSSGWGYAGGAAAGGLAGAGLSNASKVREWAMITDFVLEEFSQQPLEFELQSSTGTSGTSGAGTGNSRMSDTSANTTTNTRGTSMTQTSNYYPHGVRLSAWANQMNMSEEEAMPHIIERTTKVVQQMLPQ